MPKSKRISKTGFVLGLPSDLPASEVVARGRAEGIGLSVGYVHGIRYNAKRRGASAKSVRGAAPTRAGSALPAARANGGAERQLVELALEMGLGRAEALLARIRARAKEIGAKGL